MSALSYFQGSDRDKALGLFQIVREDGTMADEAAAAAFDGELCHELYRGMLMIRTVDARMMALQRQGRIGFYGEGKGQEASVIGTAATLEPDDWLVPALREAGAGIFRGLELDKYIAQIFGNGADISKGRQMPCHPCDRDSNYVVMSSCVANQLPHAVGIAWAMKLSGDDGKVCIGYMGDGGTSEADFHIALTFASSARAPVVLVCQNNQWAISTPGTVQTAAPTIAAKGLGYGIEPLRADGNDVLAAYTVAKYAMDKARRGGGPTFIELLTYRVSAHSSSDDPSRYRDESVTDVWKDRRDPLARLRAFMMARGYWSDARYDQLATELEQEVRRIIAEQESIDPPVIESLIEDVYEEPTWLQREQLARYRRSIED